MGSGGFRWGAGRPGWKIKHEQCLRIDIRWMARTGRLEAGCRGVLSWNHGREKAGEAGYRADSDALWLLCAVNGKPADQRIAIERTPCNYGGSRPWFGCPICRKRVAVLYLRQAVFKCRACARVAYASQSQDAIGRTWLKQQKAEAKLGAGWRRTKGMHEATARRLREIIFDCEERRENALSIYLGLHEGWL
jgi:hypothetical protein